MGHYSRTSLRRNIGLLDPKLNSDNPVLAIDWHYLPQCWIKVITEHRRSRRFEVPIRSGSKISRGNEV